MNETLPASWDDQWTAGGDPSIKHIRKIGFGACGEVHEVLSLIPHSWLRAKKYAVERSIYFQGLKNSNGKD
jgi:hypothetical protein